MFTFSAASRLVLGLVLGTLLAASAFATQAPAQAAPQPAPAVVDAACDSNRSIQVSGAATINVTPDRASIKLGVQTIESTPEQAQAKNQAAVQQVLAALRQFQIPAKDIATDYFVVQPIYENATRRAGYRVDNVVSITLSDVQKTGPVLVAALKAGANQVLDVQFFTSDLRRYRDEARNLAMKAAAEKAQALASAAGTQTGCVLHISEQNWVAYSGWWGGRGGNQFAQNVIQNAATETPFTDDQPVSVGQIAVRAEVQTSYSLR